MICEPCRIAADTNKLSEHLKCLGKTWCDCQHKEIKTASEKDEQK